RGRCRRAAGDQASDPEPAQSRCHRELLGHDSPALDRERRVPEWLARSECGRGSSASAADNPLHRRPFAALAVLPDRMRLLWALLLAAPGCEPLADRTYVGEPLFTLEGTLSEAIRPLQVDAELALLWQDPETARGPGLDAMAIPFT